MYWGGGQNSITKYNIMKTLTRQQLEERGYQTKWPIELIDWAYDETENDDDKRQLSETGLDLARYDRRQSSRDYIYDHKTIGFVMDRAVDDPGLSFIDLNLDLISILNQEQVEICHMLIDGYSQDDMAGHYGISQQAISKKIDRIRTLLEGW